MNERAPAPTPDPGAPSTDDAHLDALARPVAADGLSLALYAHEPADAVGVAHALALRLREVHGLEVEFFVPADGDGLVARLAQIVAGVPPSVLHGQAPSPAPDRVLVAADATAIPIQAEQALAALVRDCPGANTRVLLPVAGRPDRRDRRTSFGPRLVRVALDAEPSATAETGGAGTEGAAAVARPAAGTASGTAAEDAGAPSERPASGPSRGPSDGPSGEAGADDSAGSASGPRDPGLTQPVATWLSAPVPARPARRVWMIGVGVLAGVLVVALGAAWFDPPGVRPTPAAEGGAGGGAPVASRPDRLAEPVSGRSAANGAGAEPAASGAAGSGAAAPDEAVSDAKGAPESKVGTPARDAPTQGPTVAEPVADASTAVAPAPDARVAPPPAAGGATSAAAAAPTRRPDPALVRRTRDRAWFVQHAAVASADEARDWLAARPALDRAGAVPILAADGRAMVAIVTGPFPDRDSASRWAEAATPPDQRWLRGARSLKAALRAP